MRIGFTVVDKYSRLFHFFSWHFIYGCVEKVIHRPQGLFWMTFPGGWAGVVRAALLLVGLLVAGGFIAPIVTRALNRK